MPAANLSAVTLLIGAPYRGATGSLIFHLRAAGGNTPDLRRVVVPLATIPTQANAWLPLRFDPIPRLGRANLRVHARDRGRPAAQPPIYIWTATDDLLPGGSRLAGDAPAPGDLCLRVSVPDGRRR